MSVLRSDQEKHISVPSWGLLLLYDTICLSAYRDCAEPASQGTSSEQNATIICQCGRSALTPPLPRRYRTAAHKVANARDFLDPMISPCLRPTASAQAGVLMTLARLASRQARRRDGDPSRHVQNPPTLRARVRAGDQPAHRGPTGGWVGLCARACLCPRRVALPGAWLPRGWRCGLRGVGYDETASPHASSRGHRDKQPHLISTHVNMKGTRVRKRNNR